MTDQKQEHVENNPIGDSPQSQQESARISHDQAAESALRFINAFFGNEGRIRPQIHIPRDPTDDDAILMAYIKQQREAELRSTSSPT